MHCLQAEFILGSANLVPGFHQAVGGLQVGESRQMLVRADDAYGELAGGGAGGLAGMWVCGSPRGW